MNLKLLFTVCILCVFYSKLYSQKIPKKFLSSDERSFTDKEMSNLLNSTTLFVIRDVDIPNKHNFITAINSVWSLTDVLVIEQSQMKSYEKGDYSYFVLQGYNTNVTDYSYGSSMIYDIPHLFLTLKKDDINYCRIELFPDYYTMQILMSGTNSINRIYKDKYCKVKNFNPALLRLYLMEAQDRLQQSKRVRLYDSFKANAEIDKLGETDTLYVLKYVEDIYNKKTGKETSKHEISKLFKNCPMKIVVLNKNELELKIREGKVKYIFDYVKSCTDKYIHIYSMSNGLIYKTYKGGSYNLKPKDIKGIFNGKPIKPSNSSLIRLLFLGF